MQFEVDTKITHCSLTQQSNQLFSIEINFKFLFIAPWQRKYPNVVLIIQLNKIKLLWCLRRVPPQKIKRNKFAFKCFLGNNKNFTLMFVQTSPTQVDQYASAHVGNAAYIIFIMWNSISGLDTCYHFRLNISCGVAVKVRSHQEKFQVIFSWGGEGDKIKIWRDGPIFKGVFVFRSSSFFMSFSFLRLS